MDKTNGKTCAVTGRRPNGFPWEYGSSPFHAQYKKRLEEVVVRLVEEEGVSRFITGGALGIDLDVAEIVVALRQKYPFLTHLLALPYENQGGRYASKDKIRHEEIQRDSSSVLLSPHYTPWCMQVRNEYMVDEADLVVAFVCGEKKGGTYNTVRYAKKKQKPVYLFDLGACLRESTDEWISSAKPHPIEQLKLI